MSSALALEVTSDFQDSRSKISIRLRIGGHKQRAAGNGYQIKSFESALPNRVRFLVPEDLTQAPLRAVTRDGVPKLAGSDQAQAIIWEAVRRTQQDHIFCGHTMPVLLNSLELGPGLQANCRIEPL